jgi:DNA modification methylase
VTKPFDQLRIQSPKRTKSSQTGWDGFFPYYAGFPESFANEIISSANLPGGSVILDPWNGSGTTTFAATTRAIHSIGLDLNPVMIIIAKARLLPVSEADSIEPLGQHIIELAKANTETINNDDPLHIWFGKGNARTIRSIERSIRSHLVGVLTHSHGELHLDNLSSLAAANLVALFSLCRGLAHRFRSTNPTWLRYPRTDEIKPRYNNDAIYEGFLRNLQAMAVALHARDKLKRHDVTRPEIRIGNSTDISLPENSVGLLLTSPPYCTRIDYTAATRIELAVLDPITRLDIPELSRQMIGSTRVPVAKIEADEAWGRTCSKFLRQLRSHPSKASSGYYYQTHLDYFSKMSSSIQQASRALKQGALAIFVVQDSYYKEIYNDLPQIITEISENEHLRLKRRDNFKISRTMAGLHPHSRNYAKPLGALEAVLCFQKSGSQRC